MIRTNAVVLGALASVALLAPAARAQTSGTLNFTPPSSTTIYSGGPFVLGLNYTVTNLGSNSAHIEVDGCGALTYLESTSTGGVTSALNTCVDGVGHANGYRVSTTITAGADSQGTTGVFSVGGSTPLAIVPNGTQLTIPARLILDSDGSVLASDSVTFTIAASTYPGILKSFYAVAPATQPGGSAAGYNVTWSVNPTNEPPADTGGEGAYFFAGTTVVHDAVPPGAIYVGSTYNNPPNPLASGFTSPGPAYAAADLNSNASATSPGPAPSAVTDVVLSIDNLLTLSGYGMEPIWLVTYWYPASSSTVANTANATFPDSSTASASANANLGQANGSIFKQHDCPAVAIQWSTLTALVPDADSNLGCAWDPEAPAVFQLSVSATAQSDGQDTTLQNPVITDVLPSTLVLLSIDGINNLVTGDVTAQWSVSGSTDSTCGPSAGTFSPITLPASIASLASIRCIQYAYSGFTSAVNIEYTAGLAAADRAQLEQSFGAYEFVGNDAYLSGDNLISSGSTSLETTFWNAPQPGIVVNPYTGSIGADLDLVAVAPFPLFSYMDAWQGFNGVTFGATLPLELDMTAAPYANSSYPALVDDSGNLLTPDCTYGAQSQGPSGINPAWWQCTIDQHLPAFKADPYSVCGPPDFCASYDSGNSIWNEFYFNIPVKILAGAQGQYLPTQNTIWASEPALGVGGIGVPGSSATNPVVFNSSVAVEGTPQLTVQKSTPSISVETERTINYFIDYSNTGNITTTNTYVYDLFGVNPTDSQSLAQDYSSQGCTAVDAPKLTSVTHVSGTPASVVEYTTTANPTVASATWTQTAPADLSTVTGLRFQLNSAFTTGAGDYSPSDPPGREEITLQAPPDIGQKLCNMAAIGADGFNLAGALAVGGAVPITPICHLPGGCDPISNPGSNFTVAADSSCTGNASVQLNGSASTNAASWSWSENGTQIATGATPTVALPVGASTIVLTVTNSFGVSVSNSVVVTVTGCTPTANAGGDQTVGVGESCGPVAVTLDGSGSVNAASYSWSEGGTVIASGVTPTVNLALGVHDLTLTIANPQGVTSTSAVTITVANQTAPQIACPASVTATYGSECAIVYSLAPTSYSDICDPSVTEDAPAVSCSTPGFAAGQTQVTASCTITDSANLSNSCSVTVNAPSGLCTGCHQGVDTIVLGTATDSTQDSSGNFCGSSTITVPFTLVPKCGASQTEFNANDELSVTYNGGEVATVLNTGGRTGTRTAGQLELVAPTDASGSTVFTVSVKHPTGTLIASTTLTLPVTSGASCDSAVCSGDSMLFFEDLWPSVGDFDFNDQSVAYNFQFLVDENGNVDQMLGIFNLLSVGATIPNGLYLHLPIPAASNVTITLTDSAGHSLPNAIVANTQELVIPIIDNTFDLFAGQGQTEFINTEMNKPAIQGRAVSLLVTFNAPAQEQFDISQAPFDLFIARTGDYSHQIHQEQYPGTTALTGGSLDGSEPSPYYVSPNGVPFALNVPINAAWPLESHIITSAYKDLVSFANTGAPTNWYATTIDASNLYTGGSGGTSPPQPQTLFVPPLSGIYGACYSGLSGN